jgi:cyclopropane-fatty-acyl-phospholipid synthase
MSQSISDTARPAQSGRPTLLELWALKKFLNTIGNPPIRFTLWDGSDVYASDAEPIARILFHDRRSLVNMLLRPNLKFGDGYTAGSIVVEGDLLECLKMLIRTVPGEVDIGIIGRIHGLLPDTRGKSLDGSRDNIHRHYDVGNDFYRLWLDEEMVYTCAYYDSETATLERAQQAKMDHVCRKLRLRPGDQVVEAGCGWGALARHMARHYGARVRAFNISHEQIAYARERARIEGLDDRIEYIEDDYRNITGQYDVFVSVGMLEHVGRRNYQALGGVIDCVLKEDGRGLIHSVGSNTRGPSREWIETRIFPGAYVPTLGQMMDIFEPYSFSILDVENLRLHYERTLHDWLDRFDAVSDRIEEMFDASFVRAWRLYLAGCSAAFAVGNLQLFQLLFTREQNNDFPWTRKYLYHD